MKESVESLSEIKADNTHYSFLFYQDTDFITEFDCTGFGWKGVNFFIATHMVQSSRFVPKNTIDNTHTDVLAVVVQFYRASRSSLFLTLPSEQVVWRCTRSWDEDTVRTADPN